MAWASILSALIVELRGFAKILIQASCSMFSGIVKVAEPFQYNVTNPCVVIERAVDIRKILFR